VYADIAEAIEGLPAMLMADDAKRSLAQRLMDLLQGLFTGRIEGAVRSTIDGIRKIMLAGGGRALKDTGADASMWSLDNPSAQAWMDERGARLVKGISETVRDELSTFLAGQLGEEKAPREIAAAVREHFAQWPGWKSERLARTEARDAYNAATLLAGKQAGYRYAQASDASGGRNGVTDEHCKQRNGRIFTIDEALTEDEHPNGTLGWNIVATLDPEMIAAEDLPGDLLALYDPSVGRIYVSPDAGEEDIERLLREADSAL
jgi:hypothetical protein